MSFRRTAPLWPMLMHGRIFTQWILYSRTGGASTFTFNAMYKIHFSPTLLAFIGGMLLGVAFILATDTFKLYGWAALAAYIGCQLAAPLAKHLYNQEETEGGVL